MTINYLNLNHKNTISKQINKAIKQVVNTLKDKLKSILSASLYVAAIIIAILLTRVPFVKAIINTVTSLIGLGITFIVIVGLLAWIIDLVTRKIDK